MKIEFDNLEIFFKGELLKKKKKMGIVQIKKIKGKNYNNFRLFVYVIVVLYLKNRLFVY